MRLVAALLSVLALGSCVQGTETGEPSTSQIPRSETLVVLHVAVYDSVPHMQVTKGVWLRTVHLWH